MHDTPVSPSSARAAAGRRRRVHRASVFEGRQRPGPDTRAISARHEPVRPAELRQTLHSAALTGGQAAGELVFVSSGQARGLNCEVATSVTK